MSAYEFDIPRVLNYMAWLDNSVLTYVPFEYDSLAGNTELDWDNANWTDTRKPKPTYELLQAYSNNSWDWYTLWTANYNYIDDRAALALATSTIATLTTALADLTVRVTALETP